MVEVGDDRWKKVFFISLFSSSSSFCVLYPLKRVLSFYFLKDPCPFIFQETPAFSFPKKPCLFTSQETMSFYILRNLMPLHFQNLFILHIVCYLVFFCFF